MNRSGISFKITLFSFIVALLTMIGFAVGSIKSTEKLLMDSHKKTGTDMALLIARMTRNALIINDYQFLSEIPEIVGSIQEKGSFQIRTCGIISPEKKYLVHSSPAETGKPVTDPDVLELLDRVSGKPVFLQKKTGKNSESELIIATDIEVGSINWGYVVINVSLNPVKKLIRELVLKSAGAIFALSVAVLILVSIAARQSLAPLHHLNRRIRNLVEVGKIEKLSYDADDELGDLIQSFNTMMDTWRAIYDERVRRQEEADSQRRLSDAVVENIANGILVLDNSGIITRANSSLETHTSLNSEDLVGKLFWESIPGWENENTENVFRRVLETGEVYSNERVYYRSADFEKEIIFNVNICPMKDDTETTLGAVVLFEFMTDKVLLEDHLLRANEDLKRASEIKSEFLSMVSHELRTPLTLIKMYSSMLEEKKLGPLTDKQGKAIEVMSRRCRNLHELIDDLLDLSKIESGRLELHIQEVSLEELVEETAATFFSRADSANLEFSCDVAGNLPPVIADREKITRALNNLLENALKFTETGKIHVTAVKDPENDRQALVTVTDSGCGIPAEHRDKIFEKFYQVDGSDTRKHGGSGLGLSIASEIITLHQGRLRLVESSEGKGSSFSFTIPFTHPEIVASFKKKPVYTGVSGVRHDKPVAVSAPVSGKHVLLIDDDRDFLDMMADVLVEDGFVVHSATDGLEGIELLFSGHPVTIILLDVTMPLISGYELCRMMKSLRSKRSIPVLMLTAAGQSEQIQKGYDAGAAGYLVKPFTLEIFRETLLRIMGEE